MLLATVMADVKALIPDHIVQSIPDSVGLKWSKVDRHRIGMSILLFNHFEIVCNVMLILQEV